MNALPEFKFGVSQNVVDNRSLYKNIDPTMVERLTLCRKPQRCEKGENLSISTHELQVSYVKLASLGMDMVWL